MNYKILEGFLDEDFCKKLIEDANNYSRNDHISVLNNRLILPSSSLAFINLLSKSSTWQKLHDKLNSQSFLDNLLDELNLNTQNFSVTNFFFNSNPNIFQKKYKQLNSKTISTIGNMNLLFYSFYKFYRYLKRKLKYSFSKYNYVELLYDFSKSPNGYKREIHRDSDSRTIVFLIYLNELNGDGEGGDLNLHQYKNTNLLIPAQPNEQDCYLIKNIPPKTGRLITFINSEDSLHSVSEMRNYNEFRYFIYGSFTLLGKKNSFLKNSKNILKTNFNIFE